LKVIKNVRAAKYFYLNYSKLATLQGTFFQNIGFINFVKIHLFSSLQRFSTFCKDFIFTEGLKKNNLNIC
jgi:hypothetical protein